MLLVGDQFYADGPDRIADARAGYERKHKENFADPSLAAFMRQTPTFMIWDDHEIDNDWDQGQTGRYLNAEPVYEAYQNSHNPEPRARGEHYYTFEVGDTEFYVLDTRSFRSRNGAPEGPDKTMLGEKQKADLRRWLMTSEARFKFIVSSVPFNQFSNTGSVDYGPDGWQNFQTERAEIFDFIRQHCIPGVVLLTGDNHWAGVFRLPYAEPIQLYEFMPNPLAAPIRNMTEADDPQILFKFNSSLVYGLFDVDTTVSPARITHDIFDLNNNSVYHLEITEHDILPPDACTPAP